MPKTILIDATDPNIVYLLQRYAEESGFEAVCLGSEKDLLQLVQQVQPALIVLQIEPSEAGWLAALQSLRSDPVAARTPVVAYSCFNDGFDSPPDGIATVLQKSVLYGDFVLALEQAGVLVDLSKQKKFNPVRKGN